MARHLSRFDKYGCVVVTGPHDMRPVPNELMVRPLIYFLRRRRHHQLSSGLEHPSWNSVARKNKPVQLNGASIYCFDAQPVSFPRDFPDSMDSLLTWILLHSNAHLVLEVGCQRREFLYVVKQIERLIH